MTISVTGSDTDSGLSLKRKGLGISSDLMAKKKWKKKESKSGQRDSGIIVGCYQRPNHTSHDIETLPVLPEILWDTTSG